MDIHKTHQAVLAFIKAYWRDHEISPTVREIITGLSCSQGSVQNSLKQLEHSGYIKRLKRKSRNIRVIYSESSIAPVMAMPSFQGLPIRGEIAAGYCHDPFTEEHEHLHMEYPGRKPDDYVLKVSGDSMVGAAIPDGAFVGIRPVSAEYKPKAGQIVAVWVEGLGTTLKHFYQKESVVVLEAANPKYKPIILDLNACELRVQGMHIFTHWQSAAISPAS
jgi:repressor LexA